MRLFSKADKNPKTPSSDKDKDKPRPRDSASPRKKSTSSESSRSNDRSQKSSSTSSNSHKQPEPGSPRSSRRFPKSSSSRRTEDRDTHPLNLPFDQLQKRLSALSAASAMPDAMDVDTEAPSSMPGSFETLPKVNGANANGAHDDGDSGAPEPPPHKSNPASPVQDAPPTPEQAEAFKALGNKYYKAKEYKKAIDEYTKGI
jgi:DnaJ family protein C protein 7